jgi:TetR/AcrR family transcriptional regulator, repressor for neighboring sulfatase
MDAGSDRHGDERTELDPAERSRVLDVATALFAKHGPAPMTLKWVALDAEVPVDRLSAEWPSVEVLLAGVLDRISSQFQGLDGRDLDRDGRARDDELIDTFQRIIARSLLDGFNTGKLLTSFVHVERFAADLQERVGIDERTARYRLAQGFALEWGWHLFGPHLRIACGLTDEPDELMLVELRRLERRIARVPLTVRRAPR